MRATADPSPHDDRPETDTREPWWATFVDPRTGIVRRVVTETVPDTFPSSFRFTTAVLADASCWSPWPVDSCGAGYALGDQHDPVDAAVGEALERYCGNLVASVIQDSHRSLLEAGHDALDPDDLTLFSPEQHQRAGFPFRALTVDLTVDWVCGARLGDGHRAYVPASLVWASHPYVLAERGLPVTNPVQQPGLAAGTTHDQAVLTALFEIVERDAVATGWYGGGPVARLEVPAWLDRLARGPRRAFEPTFVAFPNPFDVPVVGALLRDGTTSCSTMGLAARSQWREASVKALAEAFQLQRFVADLDDEHGAHHTRADGTGPLKPWRADRAYLDDYETDLSDATDEVCHLQLHLDHRMQDRFAAELTAALERSDPVVWTEPDDRAPPTPTVPVSPPGPSSTALAELADRVRVVCGHDPVVVDLTTPDVLATGSSVRVVRVVAPGAVANTAVAHPFLGVPRLHEAVAASGGRSTPLPH